MEMYVGIALFLVGVALFTLSLSVNDEPGNWFANLMRSEFSALAITILLGFGIAFGVDSALASGTALVGTIAVGALGVFAIGLRQIRHARRKSLMPSA